VPDEQKKHPVGKTGSHSGSEAKGDAELKRVGIQFPPKKKSKEMINKGPWISLMTA